MEKVSVIDIQGVQWEVEDKNAHKRIDELKTEINKLETIEKWEQEISNYGGHIVARRQGNVISIVLDELGRNNIIPSTIGDLIIATLPERFRPAEPCFFMLRFSGSFQTQDGGTIYPSGEVNLWTYHDINCGCFAVSYIVD